MKITPYANETDALTLGGVDGLKIENRLDRVSLYGSLDLTKDRAGLQAAKELLDVLSATVAALESAGNLPASLPSPAVGKRRDPFA